MHLNILYIGLDVEDTQYHGSAFNKDTGEANEFKCRPTLKGLPTDPLSPCSIQYLGEQHLPDALTPQPRSDDQGDLCLSVWPRIEAKETDGAVLVFGDPTNDVRIPDQPIGPRSAGQPSGHAEPDGSQPGAEQRRIFHREGSEVQESGIVGHIEGFYLMASGFRANP